MSAFLALDQGTTSSRALVFDGSLREIGKAQHELEQHFPAPGEVEHDAEQILATQRRALEEAWVAAGRPAIAGVGITNQRETVVVFERATGRPIHRAIVWQDRRTAGALQRLRDAGHAEAVLARTGLPLDPYFSAAKIAWILDRVPGARARAERGELGAATIDAWLVHRLTGGKVFATEPSNASRTSLFDLASGTWSDELCALFRVPRACLPEIRASAGPFGEIAPHGWPITGVLGDQQAALFGQGCLAEGEAKCTYGTGAFLLCNAGTRAPRAEHGLLATVAWRIGAVTTFALEGSVLTAGALVQWLRDGLGIVRSAAEIEPLARSVADSGDLVIVPAFAGLGTPHWDASARGLAIGITRGTTKAHFARAALEAIACSVDDVLAAMQQALGRSLKELRVDGGAAANVLLLEIQSGLLGIPVVRPASLESTALGACKIAMVGAGVEDPREGGTPARIEPRAGIVDAARVRVRWRKAVERARGWAT